MGAAAGVDVGEATGVTTTRIGALEPPLPLSLPHEASSISAMRQRATVIKSRLHLAGKVEMED